MAICSPSGFKSRLVTGCPVMGLDLGTKTIGVALSDVMQMVASPLETIRRQKFATDSARLLQIISERSVGGIVLGLPVSMDGTEGPRCQSTRAFARNMLALADLPVTFWDERLSTVAVERMLIEDVDMTRKRRGQIIDKLAAAYILQGFLDADHAPDLIC